MRISFLAIDEPTLNRRTYPRDEMEKTIAKIDKAVSIRGLIGMPKADPKGFFSVPESSVAFRVTNIRIEGNEMVGDMEYTDNPDGLLLRESIDDNIVFRTAGIGEFVEIPGTFDCIKGSMYTAKNYTLCYVCAIDKSKAA